MAKVARITPFLSNVCLKPNPLNDQITDLLRDAIIFGEIKPGSRLMEREVADKMGVSRAPVRDAFLRLETEGLIVSRRSGRYVITLDDEQIKSIYSVRRVLECYAIQLAVEHINDADIDALSEMLAGLRGAHDQVDMVAFSRWDMEWHTYLWNLAGNVYLKRLLGSIYGPITMVVANSAQGTQTSQLLAEHEVVFAAIADRDAQRAVAGMDVHLTNACARLVENT